MKHGRLIDADALFKDICDSINEMTKIRIAVDGEWLWAKLNDALDNAPTIESEIIHCHECEHNNDCNIQYAAQAGEEFYCGAAERQEE